MLFHSVIDLENHRAVMAERATLTRELKRLVESGMVVVVRPPTET